jgi:conjugative relaxase-like TrwC/TraI family protein
MLPRLLQIEGAHLLRDGGGGAVTVSMRVMSAGDGFRYLLRTVAAGDGERSMSTPLTRYYSAKGTPPGRWMGSGLPSISAGFIAEGDQVAESQLQLLIGMGRDPVTGQPLGRAYPSYVHGNRRRRAVAGYDFTFSIPKSASVLWGIADAATQERIERAHHAAVAQALAFLEREVAVTRTGAASRDGAVAQVDVTGVTATAFDHFDSRAGDPHLHTHVVISNKVQTMLDGRWRSLDGRPMHGAVVALSELHEALFADALARELGVQWERRERGRDRHPAWAVASVPESLVREFSTRSRHVDAETDRLIDAFVQARGRRPSPATIMKLRAQATLATRPAKEVRSLADLTAEWRDRAAKVLGTDASSWAAYIAAARPAQRALRADDVPLDEIAALGASVMAAVSEKRATWRHWNLAAEAARQTTRYRFASASDREAVVGLVVDAAERASLRLSPPELASSPAAFRREDGISVFRPRHSTVFTSTELLDAESRLLDRAADERGSRLAPSAVREVACKRLPGGGVLADDQLDALERIATSGRIVDVLVGPAGAGKTTAMNALRVAWEQVHGGASVIGLAPSAAAAHVLAEDLGIATENLAKWWHDHQAHGETFRPGQLVIVDEASLAGTLPIDRVATLAAAAGAKVLFVGDPAQLQSVDAGGAFTLLVRDRRDAPELVDVHRFVNEWEKAASLGLRRGEPEAVDQYLAHGRVREGDTDAMADAAYLAWRTDARAGRATVLISDSNDAVAALNQRARTELILDGRIDALHEIDLHDGTRAAVGDTIITRRNDRRLRAGRRWVRNGDRWTVVAVHRNGSLEVRWPQRRWSTVVLPAAYVQQHVELGYAVTSYRAQGITTDTAHVVAAPGMTRENFYVAMTRGREANSAYVAIDRPDVAHVGPRPGDDGEPTARSILFGVLQHVGAELSAHETLTAEQDTWGSIAQLAAEYETIAAAAQHDRWVALVRASGLTPEQADAAIESDAFGPLTAELRRAESHHFRVGRLLASVVRLRGFEDAADVAAVLRARLATAVANSLGAPVAASRARRMPRLVAGLIPRAVGPMDAEMRGALHERAELIELRARAILDQSLVARETWTRALGQPPADAAAVAAWRRQACTVAAYRDRYGILGPSALGAAPETTAQKLDAARAHAALVASRQLSHQFAASAEPRPIITAGVPSVGREF